jgi:hypothetical protein
LTSDTVLRVALVVAAIAALIVVLGIFGTGFRIACLVLMTLAAAVALPLRPRDGGGWWWFILAGGAVASVVGAIVAQSAVTIGGILALLGGLAVIVAAAIGFPREAE